MFSDRTENQQRRLLSGLCRTFCYNCSVSFPQKKPLPQVTNARAETQVEIDQYLEYERHGVEVLEDGLKEMCFGEFLVEKRQITRFDLLRALQLQDRRPDFRIGQCLTSIGALSTPELDELLSLWDRI